VSKNLVSAVHEVTQSVSASEPMVIKRHFRAAVTTTPNIVSPDDVRFLCETTRMTFMNAFGALSINFNYILNRIIISTLATQSRTLTCGTTPYVVTELRTRNLE
jgi:hypothetical protein